VSDALSRSLPACTRPRACSFRRPAAVLDSVTNAVDRSRSIQHRLLKTTISHLDSRPRAIPSHPPIHPRTSPEHNGSLSTSPVATLEASSPCPPLSNGRARIDEMDTGDQEVGRRCVLRNVDWAAVAESCGRSTSGSRRKRSTPCTPEESDLSPLSRRILKIDVWRHR
jgi:hypothetical protein